MARRRLVASLVALAAITATSCTTYVRRVTCEGGEYRCNEQHDVKFCENIVVALDGRDCSDVGLVVGQRFCVVTADRCVTTNYAIRDRDCRVLRYAGVREWRDCSPGTPTFAQ